MTKVSVIIPVYGVEKYLREAIDSVLNQTLKDLEIILIDDGGKDNCPQIIDEYAQKDSRIIAIHKQNGGYGQSCNVGLEKATGEYVAIMEPDDYIDKNMYEDLYNIAVKNNSDIVKSSFYDNLQLGNKTYCNKIEILPNEKISAESFRIYDYPEFMSQHPSVWSCIYKRQFLKENDVKFIEAPGTGWTDNPFQVQTMCLAKRINYTNKAYYYWRRLNESHSDELKDYRLPFLRGNDIHKWLKENNLNNEAVLFNLYKREICYIDIVLGMKNITDKEDCFRMINEMLSLMDDRIMANFGSNGEDIDNKIYKKYLLFKKDIQEAFKLRQSDNFKKNIFSLRLRKDIRRLILFGKRIYF